MLRLICQNKRISRAQLARLTGLSRMSVTNTVNDLIHDNYVCERDRPTHGLAGRQPVGLDIADLSPLIAGLYISRDKCHGILSDMTLQIKYSSQVTFEFQETASSLQDKIERIVRQLAANVGDRTIIGCGISSIGSLDASRGLILDPKNFYGIREFQLKSCVEAYLPCPVILNNDMNAAAQAEKLFGNGQHIRNFLYVGMSNGIGSGIVADDMLYQRGSEFAGELGHVSINYQGPLCTCGNKGCIEVYTSIPIILEKLRRRTGKTLSFEAFCKLSHQQAVAKILDEAMEHLGHALISIVNVVNPDAILFGHEGAYLPDQYLKKLERIINLNKFTGPYRTIEVKKAYFGEMASIYGSVALVLETLFNQIQGGL